MFQIRVSITLKDRRGWGVWYFIKFPESFIIPIVESRSQVTVMVTMITGTI